MDRLPAGARRARHAGFVAASKPDRGDVDRDVLRGRDIDPAATLLPDRLSKVGELTFLSDAERRLVGRIQGRTYANMIALLERAIAVKTLDLGLAHALGDRLALEGLLRVSDEELKHQALFQRIERLLDAGMPPGYRFIAEPNDVARDILGRCAWAVLALSCHIALSTQGHYRQSMEPDPDLSPVWKDVLQSHCRAAAQHVELDEREWRRENAGLSAFERDTAVVDLIDMIGVLDGVVRMQACADTDYFLRSCERAIAKPDMERLDAVMLRAYRWQYITSGIQDERLGGNLADMLTDAQMERLDAALRPLIG